MRKRLLIDLNSPKHRRFIALAGALLTVVILVVLFSGYEAYEYTESAEFCGTVCHPMAPQFTRYEQSAHANVACAKCHIGPGASFFIKAKLDGLKQVYAVMTNTYDRPTFGHELRPARETCQECHTPTLFKDNIVKNIVHFDDDEDNTQINSTLILKMGGSVDGSEISQGIHWHVSNAVYYIASDEHRQAIVWVGVEQEDGSLKEFYSRDMLVMAEMPFVEEARKEGRLRKMDCIDCHNRTAHAIPAPDALVANAIRTGKIPKDLPNIYAKALEVLSPAYPSAEAAYEAIDDLADFYSVKQRSASTSTNVSTAVQMQPELESTLAELKEIYSETNFPEMGINWRTYPDNARHTTSPGCFRCHDGKHISVDETGKEVEVISVKCNLCHTVPIIGRGDDVLLDAPVITGPVPDSHADFSWTIEHRSITEEKAETCLDCHGRAFCNNGVCHNLSHPPDMLFTHGEEYQKRGDQVCFTCHQNVLCSRCHPGGIVENP